MKTIIKQDTIAAITTPTGTAGVSIIRISGTEAWNITLKIFRSADKKIVRSLEHSKFYYGWIINPQDQSLIDEAIVLAFKAPKSYTTEDVTEIQCHGGINVTKKILEICLQQGARQAEQGEFTKRAFIGGRIDLTQVEAVLDIISAKTELFSSAAAYNLSGKLSEMINKIRISLTNLLAQIEASLDFPDEVDEISHKELHKKLMKIKRTIQNVLIQATDGNILKQGIKVTIIGKPNVGKSSLFNYLLKSERAIVTDIPGTTRDILQETIDIDGIPVILTDTAGIRDILTGSENDYIESIGVGRSRISMTESDLILFIFDASKELCKDDNIILQEAIKTGKPLLKAGNKIDLLKDSIQHDSQQINISATTGTGIELLKQKIKETVLGKDFKTNKDEVYINFRHQECLQTALKHIKLAIEATDHKEMHDLISIDIKAALIALDEIVGEVVAESIIDRIFSQFCVGK